MYTLAYAVLSATYAYAARSQTFRGLRVDIQTFLTQRECALSARPHKQVELIIFMIFCSIFRMWQQCFRMNHLIQLPMQKPCEWL